MSSRHFAVQLLRSRKTVAVRDDCNSTIPGQIDLSVLLQSIYHALFFQLLFIAGDDRKGRSDGVKKTGAQLFCPAMMRHLEQIVRPNALVQQFRKARILSVSGKKECIFTMTFADDKLKIIFFILAIVALIGGIDDVAHAIQFKGNIM